METVSALLAIYVGNSPVTGEFPAHRPVARSFDVFFDLCLNKRFSKQWRCWWFETPWWRQCNVVLRFCIQWLHYNSLTIQTIHNGVRERLLWLSWCLITIEYPATAWCICPGYSRWLRCDLSTGCDWYRTGESPSLVSLTTVQWKIDSLRDLIERNNPSISDIKAIFF